MSKQKKTISKGHRGELPKRLESKKPHGFFAVDPSGHLMTLRPEQLDLAPGWRWATQADLDAKAKAKTSSLVGDEKK